MPPNIVLHIGAPKTGSTYLQKRLRKNIDLLEQRNVHYPVMPGFEKIAANAKRLTIALDPDLAGGFSRSFPDVNVNELDPQEELNALVGQVPPQSDKVILSSEKTRSWQAKPLADLIGEKFQCRIVLFVRKQDDWLDSYFNQLVKNRNIRSIDDALEKVVSDNDRHYFCPDWLHNYREWSAQFEDCKVIPYDDPKIDIFDRFLQVSGVTHLNTTETIEKTNTSLSVHEIVYLVRIGTEINLSEFFSRRAACSKAAEASTGSIVKPSFLSVEHRKMLRDRFQEGNTELARLIGFDPEYLSIRPEAESFVSVSEIAASDAFKAFEYAVNSSLVSERDGTR